MVGSSQKGVNHGDNLTLHPKTMELRDLLQDRREVILRRWFDVIIKTYPEETSRFLQKEKDQFANPVGHAISEGISGVYEQLFGEIQPEEVTPFLDRVIRIRAIQEFTPSQAIGFMFLLKDVIRQELGEEIQKAGIAKQLVEIESKIDKLALMAFDIYMQCREKIYELKATEMRNMTYKLLERANLLKEIDDGSDQNDLP